MIAARAAFPEAAGGGSITRPMLQCQHCFWGSVYTSTASYARRTIDLSMVLLRSQLTTASWEMMHAVCMAQDLAGSHV